MAVLSALAAAAGFSQHMTRQFVLGRILLLHKRASAAGTSAIALLVIDYLFIFRYQRRRYQALAFYFGIDEFRFIDEMIFDDFSTGQPHCKATILL